MSQFEAAREIGENWCSQRSIMSIMSTSTYPSVWSMQSMVNRQCKYQFNVDDTIKVYLSLLLSISASVPLLIPISNDNVNINWCHVIISERRNALAL